MRPLAPASFRPAIKAQNAEEGGVRPREPLSFLLDQDTRRLSLGRSSRGILPVTAHTLHTAEQGETPGAPGDRLFQVPNVQVEQAMTVGNLDSISVT